MFITKRHLVVYTMLIMSALNAFAKVGYQICLYALCDCQQVISLASTVGELADPQNYGVFNLLQTRQIHINV